MKITSVFCGVVLLLIAGCSKEQVQTLPAQQSEVSNEVSESKAGSVQEAAAKLQDEERLLVSYRENKVTWTVISKKDKKYANADGAKEEYCVGPLNDVIKCADRWMAVSLCFVIEKLDPGTYVGRTVQCPPPNPNPQQ